MKKINHNQFQSYLKKIHEISTKKVIIFPGNNHQISNHADALLLLSLISGRNPELLIGQHVKAAFNSLCDAVDVHLRARARATEREMLKEVRRSLRGKSMYSD